MSDFPKVVLINGQAGVQLDPDIAIVEGDLYRAEVYFAGNGVEGMPDFTLMGFIWVDSTNAWLIRKTNPATRNDWTASVTNQILRYWGYPDKTAEVLADEDAKIVDISRPVELGMYYIISQTQDRVVFSFGNSPISGTYEETTFDGRPCIRVQPDNHPVLEMAGPIYLLI